MQKNKTCRWQHVEELKLSRKLMNVSRYKGNNFKMDENELTLANKKWGKTIKIT
jgi:hypothetical protein